MARPPQDHQIRINEILDIAEPLFSAKGYQGTAISDIVKKMGVAQGTFYYYFKSKEEILDALIKRRIVFFLSEVNPLVYADSITPPHKIELLIQTLWQTIHGQEGLTFEFIYADRTLYLAEKLARQSKQMLEPLLLKIVEEGILQNYFHTSHPQAIVNLILAILQSLVTAMYDKLPAELITFQFELAEALIAKILGMQENAIHVQYKKAGL